MSTSKVNPAIQTPTKSQSLPEGIPELDKVLAVRPEHAAHYIGVSRSQMFELIRRGEIQSKKSGRARLVPVAALRAYLAGGDAA